MVSKKNFAQGGRPMPYRKPQMFKPINQFNNNQMFNINQIPDNPGYLDFNQPAVNMVDIPPNSQTPKKKNQKGKQKNKQQQKQQNPQMNGQNNGSPIGWPKNRNNSQKMHGPNGPNKFRPNSQRNFQAGNGGMMPMGGGNNMGHGMRMMPPMPPMPPPHFQRPPMMPPIPHMRPMRIPPPVGPMQPNAPPQFLRRSARTMHNQGGGGRPFKKQLFPNQMPPMIPPMPPMMGVGPPAPLPRMPMPFSNALGPNMGKVKKPNSKVVKKIVKGKSTIKTLKNLQNQYPLDKPWVTDEIRTEHGKKVEIEDKLKGKKDDELFAQFKTQRDKFVGMYETAREAYLKKEASEVKTKDDNGKETDNKTADKIEKGKEKNENSNA